MTLSVACHQLSFCSNKTENLNKIINTLEDSCSHLDVFPEYAMGMPPKGLNKEFVKENAETLEGEFVKTILEKTLQKKSATVFTMFLKEDDSVYNAAILADKGSIKAIYKKIHLFDAFGYKESDLFVPGRELAITKLNEFCIGLAVCFDLRFPELFRAMAYEGVNIFVVPSAWYKGNHKLDQWRILTMVRAYENTTFLLAVDQTGPLFIGHSMVVSPSAFVIKEAGDDQTSYTVDLDLTEIEEARNLIPVIQLSKLKLYRDFLEYTNSRIKQTRI